MSSTNSRPVHPCVISAWDGNCGAEYSTWANVLPSSQGKGTPNLVTAQGSTLTVYKMDEVSGKLIVCRKYPNLNGNICCLAKLSTDDKDDAESADSLLVGFGGNPRLAIVKVTPELLLATTLLDLTVALQETSHGATAPLDQDLQASLFQPSPNSATLTVILGGGVSAACLQLEYETGNGWKSGEPYLLPLSTLSLVDLSVGPTTGASNANANTSSITTGFGDIVSIDFLPGYSEPTMTLLHSNPQAGQAWPGRLGRTEGGTRNAMILTAITVTVTHERSAVLWTTDVPADACKVYATGSQGCIVQCTNSIVSINNTGQIQQTLACNGWVRTTLPSSISPTSNPWPFPKLAIALDGAEISFVNEKTAFVVLRCGQVYLLQYSNAWSLLPLFTNIGAIGQVSSIQAWPLGSSIPHTWNSKLVDRAKRVDTATKSELAIGMIFIGSRLGDSSLLGYALDEVSVADAIQLEPGLQTKTEESHLNVVKGEDEDEEYLRLLQLEEAALYGDETEGPDVVPPSDDEDNTISQHSTQRKRARLSQLTIVRSLTVLDSLTALGPLGGGTVGPISEGKSEVSATTLKATPTLGSTSHIYPCGFGSSGGLALLTVPGRDDRTILAEEDCVNAKALFSLPKRGLVLLSMQDKIRFLKLEEDKGGETAIAEVDMQEWTSKEVRSLFKTCDLLSAFERDENSFIMLVSMKVGDGAVSYSLLVIRDGAGKLGVETNIPLPVPEGESIRTVAPMIQQESGSIVIGYTLSTGEGKIIILEKSGGVQGFSFAPQIPMDMDETTLTPEEKFYAWGTIGAIDIFRAPRVFFEQKEENESTSQEHPSGNSEPEGSLLGLDAEDWKLYDEGNPKNIETTSSPETESSEHTALTEAWFVCLARQSGVLEVHLLEDLSPGIEPDPIWTSESCGHGTPLLAPRGSLKGQSFRRPQQHKVQTSEMRFFFCGPSHNQESTRVGGPHSFCLAIETSDGDTMLYRAEYTKESSIQVFRRVALKSPGHPSKEQAKHFSKLKRKGIVKQGGGDTVGGFRHNRLFRFNELSGQDGLFAAVTRPVWFVAERGHPQTLCHRSRHVAPAGSKPRPVIGFCSQVKSGGADSGFMTLHERVGRVGSQRLTLFSGLLNFSTAHGLIPGGGFFIEKIPMGVTVRGIRFIDYPDVCGTQPLYAILVSREIEEDLSNLNDDGLTDEERAQITEDKESAKIKRQVEADLGGFDMEQEWVEEIQRENCFKVDTDLGGAPPMGRSAYSMWIVDASRGWVVMDSFELDESEHGLAMEVMHLSEFTTEPGSSATDDISEEDLGSRTFITIGTGIVDKDGEDVSTKGRVVLLEFSRSSPSSSVELNFVYEKNIFHGPVNSLSCLSCDGRNRLIIGAGADVNIEQWGNGKLTQVGFFRATMHILDIKLFKNFFLLSDAYDSLYFLVWRESDKSLTLLAKDYDPIPVYATGLLSRGGSLDLVCHDDRQNLQFFQYSPGDVGARGGNKLVGRADYHLGSQTTDLQSHFCRSSLLVNSATPTSTVAALKQQDTFFGRTDDDQRLGVYFGTSDGEFGAVIPLSEPVYWRLTALQSVMVNALDSNCALSQTAWRLYRRTPRRGGCRSNNRKKGVIDGDLVIQYADLAIADQEDLASAIGSTVDLILDNLIELRCSAMVI